MHAPTTSTTLALPYSGDAFKLGWKPTMALNSPDAEVLNTGLCGTQWQCACGDDVEAAPTPAAISSSHPSPAGTYTTPQQKPTAPTDVTPHDFSRLVDLRRNPSHFSNEWPFIHA